MGCGCSQEWRVSNNVPPCSDRFLQHCSQVQGPACRKLPLPGQLVSGQSRQLLYSYLLCILSNVVTTRTLFVYKPFMSCHEQPELLLVHCLCTAGVIAFYNIQPAYK